MDAKNLLILMSDEHDPRYMGCSGHPAVRTPNLDRLAASGTRFSAAYTPSPICVPARAAFATGRPVHETGYWDNCFGYDGRVPGWGRRLVEQDHRVESIGKLHYRREDDPTGFSKQHEPMHLKQGMGTVWGSIKEPFPDMAEPWRMFNKIGPGESNYNRYDRRSAATARQWLAERAATPDDTPWILYVGFVAPHYPLVVPQEFYDLYPLDAIDFPRLHPRDGYVQHPWVKALDDHIGQDRLFESDRQRLSAVAAYHGLCSFIDAEIGSVLEALRNSGLEETTRVIYASDHGDNVGTRGLWGKSVLYEESTRIPLIVSGPDLPAGAVCETPVSLIDIYPTAVQGLGHALDAEESDLPGRSLFEIANAPADAERLVLSEYHAMGAVSAAFMLRQGRWKYHYYEGFAPELFDLSGDPGEEVDLAADPANAPVLERFEAMLRGMLDPAAVDRRAKDDQAALIERFGGREVAVNLGRAGATPVPGQSPE